MFSFFKINDPYRLIAVLLIAFAIRLPFMLESVAVFDMQHWLIIGEAMQSGNLYVQIIDSLAPFSAITYWFIVLVFGKSTLALHILGTLLLVLQAVIFNNLTIRNKVYEQNTYLPAFVFVIISSVYFGVSVLSPEQMGMTFILLAYSKLLAHVEFRAKRDEQIMSIGLLIGVAVLFYLPYILFIPIVVSILLLFTNTLQRRYLILIINGFVPLVLMFVYCWVIYDDTAYFIAYFIKPGLTVSLAVWSQIATNYMLFVVPVSFWLIGIITMRQQRRLNNYQSRLAQLFFVSGALSFSLLFFTLSNMVTALILLVPGVAFFTSHLFFLIKKPLRDFAVSTVFIGSILFVGYDNAFSLVGLVNKVETEVAVDDSLATLLSGRRIMILGEQQQLYQYGSLATPFFDWRLSKEIIYKLDYYDNIVFINEALDRLDPEIIVDYEHRWRKIVSHIPALESRYTLVRPFVWVRQ